MNEVKMWLDDVRPSPDGWFWVKTLAEAKDFIENMKSCKPEQIITHMSLDHDLGAESREISCNFCEGTGMKHDGSYDAEGKKYYKGGTFCVPCNGAGKILDVEATLFARGNSQDGSGYDLVKWMCEHNHFPTKSCIVHSWNPDGARKMVEDIKRFAPNIECSYIPYEVRNVSK